MKRDFVLDFVKAVAILAVVLGHISTPVGSFIFTWHMPVFFIVTGILMERQGVSGDYVSVFSKKDFLKYGRYYLLFGTLGILAYYVKVIFLHREVVPIVQTIVGCLIYMDMPHNIHHYGFVLWFLPAFFWAKIVTRLYLKLNVIYSKKIGIFFFGGVMILASCLLMQYSALNEFYVLGIAEGVICSVWMVLGTEAAYFLEYVQKRSVDKAYRLFCVNLLGVCLLYFIHIPALNLGGYQLESFWINVIYSFAVFIFLYVLGMICQYSHCNRIKRFFTWLSENSIYIMAVHVYTNNIVHEIFKYVNLDSWQLNAITSYLLLFTCMFIWDRWRRATEKVRIYK